MDTTSRTTAIPAIGVQGDARNGVTVKSERELGLMWEAGQIVGLAHKVLRAQVAAGMTTRELDAIAEREIVALGGKPAFKGYRGFPATLCVSINSEIVHGIPGDTVIAEGDLVSMDLGAIVGGLYGDAAITVPIGTVPEELTALLEACGVDGKAGERLLKLGSHNKLLVRVKEDLYYTPDILVDIEARLRNYLQDNERITVIDFKELVGVNRKHAVDLLETFDAEKVTLRLEDHRLLRQRGA